VLEVAVIALRWLQYSGAVVLLGAPLFLLYSLRDGEGPNLDWARPALIVAALVVALGSLAALVAQTAVMTGSLSEAVNSPRCPPWSPARPWAWPWSFGRRLGRTVMVVVKPASRICAIQASQQARGRT
jgi:hypothetical protein